MAAAIEAAPKVNVGCFLIFTNRSKPTGEVMGEPDNQKLWRDTLRCQECENICENDGTIMITIDLGGGKHQDPTTTGREDRHIGACNVGNLGQPGNESLILKLAKGKLHKFYLDFVWCQDHYFKERIPSSFYSRSLVWIAGLLHEDGFILLPLIATVLVGVLKAQVELAPILAIGFLTEQKAQDLTLCKATANIDKDNTVQSKLGKKKNQVDALGVTLAQVNQRIQDTDEFGFKAKVNKYFQDNSLSQFKFIQMTSSKGEPKSSYM
jgi:hypothetical protein